ncbi:bZIP transcription factor [Aspergillus arachidicola]|uniref:BZIP transcription factor n=1 Tax=Aspergillus arachidicola TaxID=656916 RepID=A0A2G7FHI0_9EURO|nr:bZIP transcription factor [Aspergillus arachidicola]
MANRLPPLNDVAPSSALDSSSGTRETPVAADTVNLDTEYVKLEDSPTPSASTPADADAETPAPDTGGPAGRKRKLNSSSARGVANLTPEQLAKKRANDRQAQRAIRERTKAHIDSLEHRVRELSSQKPFLDLQAALKQNEAIQAENRDIKQGLKAIMDVIQPLVGKHEASSAKLNRRLQILPPLQPLPRARIRPPSVYSTTVCKTSYFSDTRPTNVAHSYSEASARIETPSSTHSAPLLGTIRRESATNGTSASFRIAFDYQRHNLTHGSKSGGLPPLAGELPSPPMNAPPAYPSPIHGSMAEQSLPAYMTPIRNIAPTCTLDAILLDFLHHRQREAASGVPQQKLVGPPYPSVSSLLNPERGAYSHPLSKVFTDILRTFPDISSLPEQVAVLYVMFLLMRWQIYPTPENYDRVPEWLTPRPSQLLTPHPAWIDYLPWPRMRDRVVMAHRDYPFDNWFIPFTRTLSVNWPYEETDCLLSTGDNDDLIINPVFERHLRNLNNWSLGSAFAEAYPSLAETARIKNQP